MTATGCSDGRTETQQSGGAQAGHEADGVRIIGREYRVDIGQIRQRDHAARRVALQNQPARSFRAGGQRRILETVPAPRRAGIVATDESQILASLRNEMPRDRNAGGVIVKSGDGVDRRYRKIPGLDDGNAGTPQQPGAVIGRGRAHHDDRLGAPRQQCGEHVIFARGVITRLRQDHGVAERLQFVRQSLHRIGEDRIRDRRHQHADRTGAGAGERAGDLVRHVAQFPHRGLDPAPCLRRDEVGQTHHAADGDRRYARQFGHR